MSDRIDEPTPSVSLAEVMITDELARRPSRPPDYEREARALATLAQAMATSPETLLQELVNRVLTLCAADSAGVSLLDFEHGASFNWAAVCGAWGSHAGRRLAWDAAPSAVVIDHDQPILFDRPHRYFRDGLPVNPAPAEMLLVPFKEGSVPIGTVWAVAHSPDRAFDNEDVRLLTALSRFASAAHQMTTHLRNTPAAPTFGEIDSRVFAQNIVDTMRDPLLVLDANLRVISASREFYKTFRVSPEETVGTLVYELGNRQWDIPRLRKLLEEILPRQTTFRDFEVEHRFQHIGRKFMLLNARRVYRNGDGTGQILLVLEDVTERRVAEDARREAETRFTEMVKNVRDHSIFLTDREGVITSWNDSAERIIGYSATEAVGRHYSLIFSPEDVRDGVPEQELRQAREEGRAEDERWHVRKSGEPFWALGIVTPLHEPGGRLSGFSKILRDITDRKRADNALRASEARLRLALEAARMGIWTLDLDHQVQMRDANLNGLLGLEPEETTQPFEEFFTHIHPEDRSAVREAFAASSRSGQPLNIEFRIVRPDGAVRWLRDQGDVFGDAAAGARHMAGACVDVTERKEAEARVKASEEGLRLIMASATDYGILTLAPDRTVTGWSPGAEVAFGYSADEIIGRSADILFTPEDRQSGIPEVEVHTALTEGRAADERWHVRKSGSRFYASGVLTPMGDGGASGFVKVLRDLTDRKRMEDELRRAHDELELRVAERTADLQAEIERGKDLARRLSGAQEDERRRVSRDLHDSIGQLLAGLSIAVKAVAAEGALPPPAATKLADAQAIVDSLSKEAHGLAERLRPTSLDDIGLGPALGQLVSEWSTRTGVRADFYSAGLGPDRLAPEIETTLYRVVQEALTNTAKHAQAQVVSVVVSQQAGDATAVIEDDGTGFDPTSNPKGRLGLVGMKERVALVGGKLEVESGSGSGTTLYVRIPIAGHEGGGP